MSDRSILVTGAAGFIGFHLVQALSGKGFRITGVDNLNDYYDPALKRARLARLQALSDFEFLALDLADRDAVTGLFARGRFDRVLHMAAQAGVRYSLENPAAYIDSNLVAFGNILEACRRHEVGHLVFASSSSVYGANTTMPFAERHNVDHPISLYAATKKANELMAHSYASLYRLPCTGLRFFTVYGPWGRPDMACFMFARAIAEGEPIQVFNHGRMQRDFTYIDDVVEGVLKIVDHLPAPNPAWSGERPDPATSYAPYRIYNIGNNRPEQLETLIDLLERHLGRKAVREDLPMQPGDVPVTFAEVDDLQAAVGFSPSTSLAEGVARFVAWYRDYYAV
jgi:UDP-glucuronate 4-epimerase